MTYRDQNSRKSKFATEPAPQPLAADLESLQIHDGRVPPDWKDAIYDHRSSGGLVMRSLHIRAHVDKQGQVTFRMPPEFADQDVDLVVVFEPLKSAEATGWPMGFFEQTAGAWQGEPLTREPQGEYVERDPLR